MRLYKNIGYTEVMYTEGNIISVLFCVKRSNKLYRGESISRMVIYKMSL